MHIQRKFQVSLSHAIRDVMIRLFRIFSLSTYLFVVVAALF